MPDTISGSSLTDASVTEAKITSTLVSKINNAYASANLAYDKANTTVSTTGATITGNLVTSSTGRIGINIASPNTALHVNGTTTIGETIEKMNVVASGMTSSTINFDVLSQPILYYTGNSTGNPAVNFRANSTVTFENLMTTGQCISLALMVTNNATPYYVSTILIDSVPQSVKWASGVAPSAGNPNSVDLYGITIAKTAPFVYTVLASQQKYA